MQRYYEIRVESHLGLVWSSWFEGLNVRHERNGETVLSGPLADQAALYGMLAKIRDLNLELVSLYRVSSDRFRAGNNV